MRIEVEAVSRRYGQEVWACRDLSFILEPGRFVGLAGPNGAGKSTLLHMLVGIDRPTSGAIYYDGKTLHRTLKASIGYLPQRTDGFDALTVKEALIAAGRLRFAAELKIRRQVPEILAGLRLEAYQNRPIRTLSIGLAQMARIGTALSGSPSVLLLDEPLAALDTARRAVLLEYLASRRIESGSLIVMASHHLGEVQPFLTDLLFLRDGRLIAAEHLEQVRSDEEYYLTVRARAQAMLAELPAFLNDGRADTGRPDSYTLKLLKSDLLNHWDELKQAQQDGRLEVLNLRVATLDDRFAASYISESEQV